VRLYSFSSHADIRVGDVLIECKFVGSSESVSKQRSPSEAANMLAQMLEQAEHATTPWEQLVLLNLRRGISIASLRLRSRARRFPRPRYSNAWRRNC
jgi:hypothetical protein